MFSYSLPLFPDDSGKDGKEMMGTGFFGSMQLSDKSSVVLVTNYHVIGDEEVAGKSILEFEGVDVQLELKELMVETTFVCSDMKKVATYPFIPVFLHIPVFMYVCM